MDLNYWLNFKDYTTFQLSIALIGSILWVIVYYFLIKDTLQKKYIEMPYFIACGNFAWEILYAYVFDGYINLGQIYVWGYRAWFFLDIFIFFLLIKYGQKQTENQFIKKNFKIINFSLLGFFLIFFYAWISQGFDNTPIHGNGNIKLGATSAYVLNFGITLLYLIQYIKQQGKYEFSLPIAWCKAIGTALFTILFWQVDPENYLVQVLGVIIFVGDVVYIVLIYKTKSKKEIKLDLGKLFFKDNKKFAELWKTNPTYLIIKDTKLRYFEKEEWTYRSPDGRYETKIGVAEGNILIENADGYADLDNVVKAFQMIEKIINELGLQNQTYYYISDSRKIKGASLKVREYIIDFHEKNKNLKQFILITNGITRVLLKLMTPINPEVINNWITSDNLENAVCELFKLHNESNLQEAELETQFENRINGLYDMISKMSLREFDRIEKLDIPEDDRFYGVFTALNILRKDQQEVLNELNLLLNNSQQALKIQELHFKELFENSSEYVFVIDNNDKLVNYNQGAENYFVKVGLKVKPGEHISDYFPDHIQLYYQIKQEILRGKTTEFDREFKSTTGDIRSFNFKCYIVKVSETLTYQVFLIDDITDQKTLLQEKQQLSQTVVSQNMKLNQYTTVFTGSLKQQPETLASVIENLKKSLVFTSVNISNITALRNALDDLENVFTNLDKVLNSNSFIQSEIKDHEKINKDKAASNEDSSLLN